MFLEAGWAVGSVDWVVGRVDWVVGRVDWVVWRVDWVVESRHVLAEDGQHRWGVQQQGLREE
jgi:hypothetical protein